MRRSLLTTVGIVTLALAAPSAALAHHHHHNHKAKVKTHQAKFRLVRIGAGATGPSGSAPVSPTTPPAPENAGTVTSYTEGVLTLTLNGGSTVSGKVTADTRIECVKAAPATPSTTEPGPGDDDRGEGDDQGRGDMSQEGDHGSWGDSGGDGEWGDEGDGDDQGSSEPPCDTSALVPGTVVRAGELRIGPGGTEFEFVVLVR
jgi:hypothetical protein